MNSVVELELGCGLGVVLEISCANEVAGMGGDGMPPLLRVPALS